MQNLIRRWVGLGREFTVEQASAIVKRKHGYTRKRRIRYLVDNPHNMTADELLRFMQLAGPKFTNEFLEIAGQTGAISIKGWVNEEAVGEAMAKWQSEYFRPGNGKDRKLRRALLRLIRRARAHLSGPRLA